MREVSSLDDPALLPYRTLKQSLALWRAGLFVAEGCTVIERLVRSGLEVRSVLLAPRWRERLGPTLARLGHDVPVFVAEQSLLESITGFEYHEGALAVARRPPERALEEVLRAQPRREGVPGPRVLVALDGVTSAENTGAIVRSAVALGASAILSGPGTASPFLRRAVRISMGGVFFVPVVHCPSLVEALSSLAGDHGFRIVGAEAHGGGALEGHVFAPDTCLVLGHEFRGLGEPVRSACHEALTIPLGDELDSLNVAAAAAILLWEFRRQNPTRVS